MVSSPASTHALHAQIASAELLVDERRALYRLGLDLSAPDVELSDNHLDHPVVRYEIGRALAGHGGPDLDVLQYAVTTRVRDAGVPLVADPRADEQLEAPLRIVAPSGEVLRLLTAADGDRFDDVAEIVAQGVGLFRRLAPEMAADLLAHVSMLAVLRSDSTGGVVSASSRYVPGIVLIEEPGLAMEVAEALVHEGAHEKFFDLAMARDFLDRDAEDADYFVTSWSGARWPLEQTFAAWHAYSHLARFAPLAGSERPGSFSLLSNASERADEIGDWLIAHERYLRADARWLLHSLAGRATEGANLDDVSLSVEVGRDDRIHVQPALRCREALSGRVVVGWAGQPPTVYWLDADAGWVLGKLQEHDGQSMSVGSILPVAVEEWRVDLASAERRLLVAVGSLLESSLVGTGERRHQTRGNND